MSAEAELVPVAEKLRTAAAAQAADADRSARLSAAVVLAIQDSGIVRHFVPRRWGGTEGSFLELTQAVAAIAEGCPATAWIAALAASSSRFAAFLPEQGQREVWGTSPNTVIATGLVAAGTANPVDGGWQIKGTWSYVSGIEWADWVLLCGPGAAERQPPARFFAVPKDRVTIRYSWDNAGMRATGSHTVTVADAFVPEHCTFPRSQLMTGRNGTSTAPCHVAPFGAVGGLTFAGPVLGAGIGLQLAALDVLAGKPRNPLTDRTVARAAGQLDGARLLIERAATVLDSGPMTRATTARNARDTALAADLVLDACAALVRVCGTTGLTREQPLERLWRDVTCAASHVALRQETSATTYVDTLLPAA